jgi:hypothetical protein
VVERRQLGQGERAPQGEVAAGPLTSIRLPFPQRREPSKCPERPTLSTPRT